MSKMPRVREIAAQVKNGAITFQKGYNKVLNAIKSADRYEIPAYLCAFESLCKA